MDRQIAERVRAAVRRFAETGQGDVTRLVSPGDGARIRWRLRLGDWRVRFFTVGEEIVIDRVLHRREAYR